MEELSKHAALELTSPSRMSHAEYERQSTLTLFDPKSETEIGLGPEINIVEDLEGHPTVGQGVAIDAGRRVELCRELEAIVGACRRSCEDVERILEPFTRESRTPFLKGKDATLKLRGLIPSAIKFASWHKHLARALPTLPERTQPDNESLVELTAILRRYQPYEIVSNFHHPGTDICISHLKNLADDVQDNFDNPANLVDILTSFLSPSSGVRDLIVPPLTNHNHLTHTLEGRIAQILKRRKWENRMVFVRNLWALSPHQES
jgi:hypothetical protein